MAPSVKILYRVARFWSGLPPNAETYLLAVAERPEVLVGATAWAVDALAGALFTFVLKLVLVLYVWSWLPVRIRRGLIGALGYFLPGAVARDPDREKAGELEARVRELERRLEGRDNLDEDGDGER